MPIVILLTGALALGACGDDDDGDGGSAPAASGGQAVKLSATDFEFTPSSPSVTPGKVTFQVTNDGKVDHALEVEGPKGEAETSTIAAGKTASLTVDLSDAGSYEMYCPVGNHRQMGMEGTVRVGGGSAPAEDDGGAGRGY